MISFRAISPHCLMVQFCPRAFNATIEQHTARTYEAYHHLAPVPDIPVPSYLSSGSSSDTDEQQTHRQRGWSSDRATSSDDTTQIRAPRRSAAQAPVQDSRVHTRVCSSPSLAADHDQATSSVTENDQLPAFQKPLQSERQAVKPDVRPAPDNHDEPDVIPMDIDEPSSSPVLSDGVTAPSPPPAETPVLSSCLSSTSVPQAAAAQQRAARTRRASPLPRASSSSSSSQSSSSTSTHTPPRRTLRTRPLAQAVQHWALCGACSAWRTLDARWLARSFECSDAGSACGTPCAACASFPCNSSCEK